MVERAVVDALKKLNDSVTEMVGRLDHLEKPMADLQTNQVTLTKKS